MHWSPESALIVSCRSQTFGSSGDFQGTSPGRPVTPRNRDGNNFSSMRPCKKRDTKFSNNTVKVLYVFKWFIYCFIKIHNYLKTYIWQFMIYIKISLLVIIWYVYHVMNNDVQWGYVSRDTFLIIRRSIFRKVVPLNIYVHDYIKKYD